MSDFFQFKQLQFPDKKGNPLHLFKELFLLIRKLRGFKIRNKSQFASGHLMTYPSKWSNLVWRLLVSYNPGNLGNWSVVNRKFTNLTGRFESEVIAQMLDLYQVSNKEFGGYFTSGATEANIFSAWLGRKKLKKELKKNDKICLLRSDLSHYSLAKAADVVGLDDYSIPINDNWTGINPNLFSTRIKQLYKKGYRGFLLPLTYGFTLTGTDDDVSAIVYEIKVFKKKYPDTRFFVWIDAALSGLIQPFINEKWSPIEDLIETFVVDFHKFGHLSQPAGMVIYRHELLSLIEKPIDYLEQNDNTLLGSRTGISPVAAWMNLRSYGRSGLKKRIESNLENKNKFIEKYSQYPELKIVTSPHNLNLAMIIKSKKKYWSNYFNQQYDVLFKKVPIQFANKKEVFLIGKVFFLN